MPLCTVSCATSTGTTEHFCLVSNFLSPNLTLGFPPLSNHFLFSPSRPFPRRCTRPLPSVHTPLSIRHLCPSPPPPPSPHDISHLHSLPPARTCLTRIPNRWPCPCPCLLTTSPPLTPVPPPQTPPPPSPHIPPSRIPPSHPPPCPHPHLSSQSPRSWPRLSWVTRHVAFSSWNAWSRSNEPRPNDCLPKPLHSSPCLPYPC